MKPANLSISEQVRIISPSGAIEPSYIDGSKLLLQSWGFTVTEGKYARESWGRFAGTIQQRIADIQEALDDHSVKAILCSRGGYGLVQLIDKLDFTEFVKSPKWIIGFSDITIFHNTISKLGIASIHGIMAKHLTELPSNCMQILNLKDLLFGKLNETIIKPHLLNKSGIAKGKLVGGNLSVLMGLRGTAFDLDYNNTILFLEDVSEKPYHIDRMMQNLRLSGALSNLSGLIIGQFSDCEEDPLMKQTIDEIIFSAVIQYDYPVCFNFPVGHVDFNLPIIVGENAYLNIDENKVTLSY